MSETFASSLTAIGLIFAIAGLHIRDLKIKKLKKQLNQAVELVRTHHRWHLDVGVMPQELVGIDMSAEYCDSTMFDDTKDFLNQHYQGRTL